MRKKKKLLIIFILPILLSIFIFSNPLLYYKFFDKNITVINNVVYASSLPDNTFKSTYIPRIKFEDRPITKVNGIRLNILNESNITNISMLLKSQRYYIPLDFICSKLNYTINAQNNRIILSNTDNKISLTEKSYTKNSITGSLRGNLINSNYSAIAPQLIFEYNFRHDK